MSDLPDVSLLREFSTRSDEQAFAELMRRHLPAVYSAAARRLEDDQAAAEDVTQSVFLQLAQRSGELMRHPVLAGWLHVTALQKAADRSRQQARRMRREHAYAAQSPGGTECAEPDWTRIKPLLDEALQELAEAERHAVLLRFFAGREFAAVGRELGVSADAARMRVSRGLEKLRGVLGRRGIVSSVAALEIVLAREAVAAVPEGLASSISRAVRTLPLPEAAASLSTAVAKLITAVAVMLMVAAVGTAVVRSWRARHPGTQTDAAGVATVPKGLSPDDAIRFLRGHVGKRAPGGPVDPKVEQALGYLRSALFDTALGAPERWRLLQESAGMLVGAEGETIALFREALTSADPQVVRMAVEGIARFGQLPREFGVELLAVLENPEFKADAGLIANRLGWAIQVMDSAVPTLLSLLERRPDLSHSIQDLLGTAVAASGDQLASNRRLVEALLTDSRPEIQALAKAVLDEVPQPPPEPTPEVSSRLAAGLAASDPAERSKAVIGTMRLSSLTPELQQTLADVARKNPSVQLRAEARMILEHFDPSDPELATPAAPELERATKDLLAREGRSEASVADLIAAVVDRSADAAPVLERLAKLGSAYWTAHGDEKGLVVGALASLHQERDARLYETITEAYAQVNGVPRSTYPLDQLAPYFAAMESSLTAGEYAIAMRDLKSSLEMYWKSRGFTQREPTHLPADLVGVLLVGPYHQNRPAYDQMLRAIRAINPAFQPPLQ